MYSWTFDPCLVPTTLYVLGRIAKCLRHFKNQQKARLGFGFYIESKLYIYILYQFRYEVLSGPSNDVEHTLCGVRTEGSNGEV